MNAPGSGRTLLLAAALLPLLACNCTQTEYYAVGAKDFFGPPVPCKVVDPSGGVLAASASATRGGLEIAALKPGTAKIECRDTRYNKVIEVREPVRIAFDLEGVDLATPIPVGKSAPSLCVDAFDSGGRKLQLGSLIADLEIKHSAELSSVADHGMGASIFGGGPNHRCRTGLEATKEGRATISAVWRTLTATSSFEVKGTSR